MASTVFCLHTLHGRESGGCGAAIVKHVADPPNVPPHNCNMRDIAMSCVRGSLIVHVGPPPADHHMRGVDGVVCSHIHHPEICEIGGVLYCNDGDWVESLSALVETHDGALKIITWHDIHALLTDIARSGKAQIAVPLRV